MTGHHLHLLRDISAPDHTYGELTFYDFDCITIEDEHRDVKIQDETCIAEGTYQVVLRNEGGMNQDYQDRFPEIHKGMLWLRPTDGNEEIENENGDTWTWVYIHCGVTDDHTSGCIIVGRDKIVYHGQAGVSHSSDTYRKLYALIIELLDQGDDVFIHIKQED